MYLDLIQEYENFNRFLLLIKGMVHVRWLLIEANNDKLWLILPKQEQNVSSVTKRKKFRKNSKIKCIFVKAMIMSSHRFSTNALDQVG